MFRSFKRACLWLALICLLSGMRAALGEMAAPPSPGDAASGDAAGGLDASSGVTVLFLNSRERHVCAEGLRTYAFTCPRDGNYVFCGLRDQGDAGSVSVVLRGEGRIMGSGRLEDIFSLPAALREGETYTLAVNGGDAQATLAIEVMADAYGRCAGQPIVLEDQSVYTRAVVEARDIHWYAFTPHQDGYYTIRALSEGQLDTHAYLLDADFREVAYADDILFPGNTDFRLFVRLRAGERYYVRVSAGSNQTGAYQLTISAPTPARQLPRSAALSTDGMTLKPGMGLPLRVVVEPSSAAHAVSWASASPDVCSVNQDGIVTALRAGTAVIHAYCAQEDLTCVVTVSPIELTGLGFSQQSLSLPRTSTAELEPVFTPENASFRDLTYTSSDEAVAAVDAHGVVTALSEGSAVIKAESRNGLMAEVQVTVTPRLPVYRALVVGEQNYEDGRTRLGGYNTASGVADMLRQQDMGGLRYSAVTLMVDSTREELLTALADTFAGAEEGDISLVYINCHGDADAEAWIELHDGTRITAPQLRQALLSIPGRVALIVDCCRSGRFLWSAERFTERVAAPFTADMTPFGDGKFIVITSAGVNEDSYRRSFVGEASEQGMATIMARSLCEGAGWDLIDDRLCTLKADFDRDRLVTVQEIWRYTEKRVMYYLDGTGVTQSVRLWPEGDQTVIFGRSS